MSDYTDLQQLVGSVADDAQKDAFNLKKCADKVDHIVVTFDRLIETTRDPSAETVRASFRSAQKQLLIAAKALVEAAEAGHAWSGESQAELKLVLRRRR